MFTGTVFGLILVPGLYVLFAKLAERFKSGKPTDDEDETSQSEAMNLI